MILKILLLLNLLFSPLVLEDMIFRAENGVTLKANDVAEVGKEYMFEGKSYLIVDDSLLRELITMDYDLSKVVTTKVTDMSFLFYNNKLKDLQIQTWDVSNVTTMSWMFGLAEGLNPDISFWDTRSVIEFSDMFHGAKSFNGDLSRWNTSSGKLFNGMFFDSRFDGNINDWDISSAINLSGMFDDARFFNQPLDKWNTSNVEDMGGMFAEAITFDQDLSMWDVRNVNNMTNMFRNAIMFNQDLSNWKVPNITEAPVDFSTKSRVVSPKWGQSQNEKSYWLALVALFALGSLSFYFYKFKKKPVKLDFLPENELYGNLKKYLIDKGSIQITKAELDELIGATSKSLDTQKKIRSTFIKEFNASGIGKIYRVRDDFDSRSFNYEIKWEGQLDSSEKNLV
jgi:surface protein